MVCKTRGSDVVVAIVVCVVVVVVSVVGVVVVHVEVCWAAEMQF
jgi:hypothetical protein